MKELARQLDRLAERDEKVVEEMEKVDAARRRGACALHELCANFSKNLNLAMTKAEMVLVPTHFDPEAYRDDVPNLIQMSLRGRIAQIQYEAPEQSIAMEHFREPYILQGGVQGFNQSLLERDLIEEQMLFYAKVRRRPDYAWQYFEPRTYRSGSVDEEYLTKLFARLA